jgi:hypothetical protein
MGFLGPGPLNQALTSFLAGHEKHRSYGMLKP